MPDDLIAYLPQSFRPTKPRTDIVSDYSSILAAIRKNRNLDSTTDVGPSAFDVRKYLLGEAANEPGQLDVEAAKSGSDATYSQELLQRLNGMRTPQREPLTAPNVSPLSLPAVPKRTAPSANPTASLAAGLLGLFAPGYAGDFGAAALHGAIQEHERQYQANQEQFAQTVQQRIQLHNDELRRENVRAEIENENKAIAYDNSVAATAAEKEKAQATAKSLSLSGLNQGIKDLVDRARTARGFGVQADIVKEQHVEQVRREEAQSKREGSAVEHVLRLRESRDRAEEVSVQKESNRLINQQRADELERHNKEIEKMGVYGRGFIPNPTGPPTVAPASRLPLKTQAEIDNLNARTTKTTDETGKQNSGWASLEWRKQHAIAESATKELDKLNARAEGGSGTTDPTVKARIKDLWDTRKRAFAAMEAIDTSARLPKNQRQTRPDATRKQFKGPDGVVFWAHVENGKWVKE